MLMFRQLFDPVFEHEQSDSALLRELGLQLVATLDTQDHADHVSAAWLLKQRCGSQMLLSEESGAANADRLLQHGDQVSFGTRNMEVRATPGHTSVCLSYVLDHHSMAFTGDSLLIRGCGRTDFQQGSLDKLFAAAKCRVPPTQTLESSWP